jgi:hypothetical protein
MQINRQKSVGARSNSGLDIGKKSVRQVLPMDKVLIDATV